MENKREIDFIDEDPPLNDQKYYLLSYQFSKEIPDDTKIIMKMRGAYKTETKADKAANKLRGIDNYFHIYKAETGKWVQLLSPKQIEKYTFDGEIDENHLNNELNVFMKSFKEERDKADLLFRSRKDEKIKQVKEDAALEGQIKLSEKETQPVAIISRMYENKRFIKDNEDVIEGYKEDIYRLVKKNAFLKNQMIKDYKYSQELSKEEFLNYRKEIIDYCKLSETFDDSELNEIKQMLEEKNECVSEKINDIKDKYKNL